MSIVIKHPTKGFFQKNDRQGGVWVGSNNAHTYAKRFESIEDAERVADTLTSLAGKKLKGLTALSISLSGKGNHVFLAESFHKKLS